MKDVIKFIYRHLCSDIYTEIVDMNGDTAFIREVDGKKPIQKDDLVWVWICNIGSGYYGSYSIMKVATRDSSNITLKYANTAEVFGWQR